jgi:hypothetical protein
MPMKYRGFSFDGLCGVVVVVVVVVGCCFFAVALFAVFDS